MRNCWCIEFKWSNTFVHLKTCEAFLLPYPAILGSVGFRDFIWCWQFEKLTFFFWIWAGIIGGVVGLVSKHQYVHGLAIICATYATNLAIVTGCCCGNKNLCFLKFSVMWLCCSFSPSLCLFSFFIFFSSFIKAILKSHEISIATYNCLPLRV